MFRHVTALALALFVFTPAMASGPGETHHEGASFPANGSFTYRLFEASVEHVELSGCPAQFDPDAVFCRMTLAAEMAHVFVFSFNGDQPLLVIESFALDDGFLPF
jgi:hypothetical protein